MMDSLVDLVCFFIKRRLNYATPEHLLQLKRLPDELLIRIGQMPHSRPYLTWQDEHYRNEIQIVMIKDVPNYINYFDYSTLSLPLILTSPLIFYARCSVNHNKHKTSVRLTPAEGYIQYRFLKEDLIIRCKSICH
jgi:hypothetical protein